MKKNVVCAVALLLTLAPAMLSASGKKETPATDYAAIIADIPTVQAFKSEAVPFEDVEKIVAAGVNAQSAINKQPWHFTVVPDSDVMAQIAEKMKSGMPKMPPKADGPSAAPAKGDAPANPPAPPAPGAGGPASGPKAAFGDSPVAIVVSAKDGSDLDAGLAAEVMTAEAVLLGYGTKIVSSPTIVLNGPDKAEYQKLLGIPADMSVKCVILIGYPEDAQTDAVSTATIRKDSAEVVTYIK